MRGPNNSVPITYSGFEITQKQTKGNRSFFFLFFVVSTVFVIVQISLGVGILYIVSMISCLTVMSLLIFVFNTYNLSVLLALALLSKYSFIPFLLKSILGERIDEGLWNPEETFLVLTIGSVLVFFALLVEAAIPVNKRLLDVNLSDGQIRKLSLSFYFIGFFFSVLHTHFSARYIGAGQVTGGFGGFGEFEGLTYLGVILATVRLALAREKGGIDTTVFLMLLGALGLSLLANSKVYFVSSVLSYMVVLFVYTPGYFGSRRGLKHIFYMLSLLMFFVYVMAPIIHTVRDTGINAVSSIPQRFQYILSNWNDINSNLIYFRWRDDFDTKYFDTIENPLVDRLAMIEDLDLVVSGINRANTIGFEPIVLAITSSIPSFLISDKKYYNDVALIGDVTGIASGLGGYYRNTGAFAVSYAMFMWPGWMVLIFFLYLLFFLYLKKIVLLDLRYSIWAIYVLIKYGFLFTETSMQGMLQIMIRGIPIDIVSIYFVLFVTRKLGNQSSYSPKVGR